MYRRPLIAELEMPEPMKTSLAPLRREKLRPHAAQRAGKYVALSTSIIENVYSLCFFKTQRLIIAACWKLEARCTCIVRPASRALKMHRYLHIVL